MFNDVDFGIGKYAIIIINIIIAIIIIWIHVAVSLTFWRRTFFKF